MRRRLACRLDAADRRFLGLEPLEPRILLSATVVGEHLFYNDSAFDGYDPGPGSANDAAIAIDLESLAPGEVAAPENVSNYHRGINGLMVDVLDLAAPNAVSAQDFSFRVGNVDDPQSWASGPSPSIVHVREDAGDEGSDRIELIWSDTAIQGEWLKVVVKANQRTGLAGDHAFYFGNLVAWPGESETEAPGVNEQLASEDAGGEPVLFEVGADAEALAREHTSGPLDSVPIDSPYDYTRSGEIGAKDQLIARTHQTATENEHGPAALAAITTADFLPVAFNVQRGTDVLTVPEGETRFTTLTLDLGNIEAVGGQTVQHTFEVEGLDGVPDDGIALDSDFPSSLSATNDLTRTINTAVEGFEVGEYRVRSTAAIQDSTRRIETEFVVSVIDPEAHKAQLSAPGTIEAGITVGEPTDITFTSLFTGTAEPPQELTLHQTDGEGEVIEAVGMLRDDGAAGVSQAGNNVFTGTFEVTADASGPLYYQTSGDVGDDVVHSDLGALHATAHPIGSSVFNDAGAADVGGLPSVPGQIIVEFNDGVSDDRIGEIAESQDASIIGSLPSLNNYQLEISNGTTVEQAITAFESHSEVAEVEPNVLIQGDATGPIDPADDGQENFYQVRANEALALAIPDMEVPFAPPVVAVLDTGVDYEHPDLQGQVLAQSGYDFINDNSDAMDDEIAVDGDGNVVLDNTGEPIRLGHGTHVAGIIAAQGVGVTGINPHASILPVKVLNSHGSGSAFDIADGVRYAVDQGARVLNMSLGGDAPTFLQNLITGYGRAIEYALDRGRVVVTSAGNDAVTTEGSPSVFDDRIITVGSVDQQDNWSDFGQGFGSNWGPWVDIVAPGSDINSTIRHDSQLGQYRETSGTSMAAPHVSAAASLLWAHEPTLSSQEVRARLIDSAAKLTEVSSLGSATALRFPNAGRLDVFDAVFNGSFGAGVAGWETEGSVNTQSSLGVFDPVRGDRFAFATTGPSGQETAANMHRTFRIADDVNELPISFDYNFLSEEWPEWWDTQYNDTLTISLIGPGNERTELAFEEINQPEDQWTLEGVEGVDIGSDSDQGIGQSMPVGWQRVETVVDVTPGELYTFDVDIFDQGDDLYNSAALLDNIRFEVSG